MSGKLAIGLLVFIAVLVIWIGKRLEKNTADEDEFRRRVLIAFDELNHKVLPRLSEVDLGEFCPRCLAHSSNCFCGVFVSIKDCLNRGESP